MDVIGYGRINGKETMSTDSKNQEYWQKRRKNNEAARRSREKRRINDIMLERRVMQLSEENKNLRTQLMTIKMKYGEMERLPMLPSPGTSFDDQDLSSSKCQLFRNTVGDTSATVLVNNSADQKCASLLSPIFLNNNGDIAGRSVTGDDLTDTSRSPQVSDNSDEIAVINKDHLQNYITKHQSQSKDMGPPQSQADVMRAIHELYSLCGHIMRDNRKIDCNIEKQVDTLSRNEIEALECYRKEKERLRTLDRLMSFYNGPPIETEKSTIKTNPGRVSPYTTTYVPESSLSPTQIHHRKTSSASEGVQENGEVLPVSSTFQLPYKLRIKQTAAGNKYVNSQENSTNKSKRDIFSTGSEQKVPFLAPLLYPRYPFPDFGASQYLLEKNRRYSMYL